MPGEFRNDDYELNVDLDRKLKRLLTEAERGSRYRVRQRAVRCRIRYRFNREIDGPELTLSYDLMCRLYQLREGLTQGEIPRSQWNKLTAFVHYYRRKSIPACQIMLEPPTLESRGVPVRIDKHDRFKFCIELPWRFPECPLSGSREELKEDMDYVWLVENRSLIPIFPRRLLRYRGKMIDIRKEWTM